MSNRNFSLSIFGLVAVVVLALNSLFIVGQTQQALVLQFGRAVDVIDEPGLKAKIPFVQNVLFFDKRLLDFNTQPQEVIDADNKPIIIDAFLRYRINNPLKYYQSVQDERAMNQRLDDILESSLRKVVGRYPYTTLLSPRRVEIMSDILSDVREQLSGVDKSEAVEEKLTEEEKVLAAEVEQSIAEDQSIEEIEDGFGIKVVDVRLTRVDLSERIKNSVHERMRSDREREARELRAKGEEAAQRLRSKAERERTEIVSQAKKEAEIIRGEADAVATKTYADAFSRDKDFYDFYRTLQAYRQVLDGKDTTMIMSPDNQFLKYLKDGE
ncbi:MAG: protease modulator HflC [Alphaproteobacteria bacterium]|nr:protease modulator HflC [Alphaproteobacteria bacterium]